VRQEEPEPPPPFPAVYPGGHGNRSLPL
jgi:hypothetical protein